MYTKQNIKNNKSKYAIIGIIIFILSFVTIIGFTISTSANDVLADTKEEYGSYVTIAPNMENMTQGKPGNSPTNIDLTKEEYETFGESDLVEYISYISTSMVSSSTIDGITSASSTISDSSSTMKSPDGSSSTSEFLLYGIDSTKTGSDTFSTKKLTSGNLPLDSNQVLISESLAEENNLKIGDEFKITSDSGVEYSLNLTISGLYSESDTTYLNSPRQDALSNPNNVLITNLSTLEKATTDLSYQVTYKLNNYLDVDAFEQELYDKGLSTDYVLDANEDAYAEVVTPLSSMIQVTKIFMIIIILVGLSILIFISMLTLKERKYELGVLRAMGMKKKNIIHMILKEMMLIASIAILIATLLGITLSGPIGNSVYAQISSEDTSSEQQMGGPGDRGTGGRKPGGLSTGNVAQKLESIPINVSIKVVLMEILLMLLIIFLSTLITIRYILTLDTSKLLRERE